MATLNLGQVRPVYRGAWNSIDTYVAYDFVIYNGSAYLALKDVPANYEPPSQNEYWALFGAKGEPGTPGVNGTDGAPGERGPSPAYRWDGTFLSIQNPDGTFPDQGVDLQGPTVPISNSVTSTSETEAASSLAAKTAYDAAKTAQNSITTLREDVPSIAAHAAGPSNKYIKLTYYSFPYIAPANGWVGAFCVSTEANHAFTLKSPAFIMNSSISNRAGQTFNNVVPVSEGQLVEIVLDTYTFSEAYFIYANGNTTV